MKIIDETVKFTPVRVIIEFENPQEIAEMYHRLNLSVSQVMNCENNPPRKIKKDVIQGKFYDLFQMLEDYAA